MENDAAEPARRERVGSHAWVRTVGLVGGGLVAGGILAGTLTATAAEDTTSPTPSVTQEEGATTDDGVAPEDCPEGSGASGAGDAGARSGSGTDRTVPGTSAGSPEAESAA